jgi:gluconokinase
MGVSGVGKSTIARRIAGALGWPFAEGDDFHPEANRQKMAAGIPLTDEDRWPWLRSIGAWMDERLAAGESAVVTCSALKRCYRDLLCEGRPTVRFCELDAPPDLIADRLVHRTGHYLPPALLPSQLAALEPLAEDEPGVHVSVAGQPDEIVQHALAALGLNPPQP